MILRANFPAIYLIVPFFKRLVLGIFLLLYSTGEKWEMTSFVKLCVDGLHHLYIAKKKIQIIHVNRNVEFFLSIRYQFFNIIS